MFDASDFTLKNIGKADLIIYITDNLKDNLLGIAPLATLCKPSITSHEVCLDDQSTCKSKPANAWKFSINEYLKSVASMGKVCLNNIQYNISLSRHFITYNFPGIMNLAHCS